MSFYVCKTTTKSFCYIWKPFWFCLCYHLYSVKTPEFFRALLQTIPTTPDLIFPSHLIFNMPSLYFEGLKFFLTMKNPYLQHWNKKKTKKLPLVTQNDIKSKGEFPEGEFSDDKFEWFIWCFYSLLLHDSYYFSRRVHKLDYSLKFRLFSFCIKILRNVFSA